MASPMLRSPYSPSGPGGVAPALSSPVLRRSQSDQVLWRPADPELQGWASSSQFSTTYRDQCQREQLRMQRSAPDLGTLKRKGEDPRLMHGRRPAGMDYVAKASEEFPPLAEACTSLGKSGTIKRWLKHVYDGSNVANFAYGNWNHVEPPMSKNAATTYIPYTNYNTDLAQKDSRPNCFEFKAGYRHSDYPLTKMSTSITELPRGKKFYSNVHPKEIPNGREWQWTFRSQNVGRLSCNLYKQ